MSAAMVARARESLLEVDGATSRKEASEGGLFPPVVLERGGRAVDVAFVHEDEEQLSCEPESFDLVVSCLSLHWVNDLPMTLLRLRFALKPDGFFLGAMLGGDTLREMRIACAVAQLEREGGISARLSPFAQVRDAGSLLTSAGFALPSVDVDDVTVNYSSPMDVVEHLRSLAEINSTKSRDPLLRRDTALAAAAVYHFMSTPSGAESPSPIAEGGDVATKKSTFDDQLQPVLSTDTNGQENQLPSVPATYQVIFLSGWAPHDSQPVAKERGSATVSFHDLQQKFNPE